MTYDGLKIVFIYKIGVNHDGLHEYEILYSDNPEDVWAEDFAEQVPSVCHIEDIMPDESMYSLVRRGVSERELNLALYNSCFSLQDCMDDIICLAWYDDGGKYVGLHYGADIAESDEFFSRFGLTFTDEMLVDTVTNDNDSENLEDIYNGNF